MALPPSPGIDTKFTRARLKEIAAWIRDDLDRIVARHGPDSLRPDDVLALHDIFVAFRLSSTITAMDLRSSGIHNAVKMISDGLTRWPTRLRNECDKIVSTWTAKFGDFGELHPFLHGRGGRLEGIGNSTEFSRQALLRRWSKLAAAKIDPKVSHRRGGLGFRAGAWWINALFAHHAGIIGLESVEGGTTFDDHGAYAVVVQDAGDVSTTSQDGLRIRTSISDRGKFRLAAATPKSREPVRVLRSFNVNSTSGRNFGIRYEGLYVVKGWSIRLAKNDDIGRSWKQGDILYEIEFERNDLVSLGEVLKHPTNMELDDYMEYSRLRKKHRESKRQSQIGNTVKFAPHLIVKDAPRIRPALVAFPSSESTRSTLGGFPGSSGSSLVLNRSTFDPYRRDSRPVVPEGEGSAISPKTAVSNGSEFPFVLDDNPSSESSVQGNPQSPTEELERVSSERYSDSIHTSTGELMEIAPWMDREPSPELPFPSTGRSGYWKNASLLDTVSITGSKPMPKSIAIDSSSHSLTYSRRESPKRDWTGMRTSKQHVRPGFSNKASSLRYHAISQDIKPMSLHLGSTQSISSDRPNTISQAHNPRVGVSKSRLISKLSISSKISGQSAGSRKSISQSSKPRAIHTPSISSERHGKHPRPDSPNSGASNTGLFSAHPTPSESGPSVLSRNPSARSINSGGDSTNEYSDYLDLSIHDPKTLIYPSPSTTERRHQMQTGSLASSLGTNGVIPLETSSLISTAGSPSRLARGDSNSFEGDKGFAMPHGERSYPTYKRITHTHACNVLLSEGSNFGRAHSLSDSLKDFITQAKPAAPVGSPTSASVLRCGKEGKASEDTRDMLHLKEGTEQVFGYSQIVFKDPFRDWRVRDVFRKSSSSVAPDMVS